jgi:hypothetical protein
VNIKETVTKFQAWDQLLACFLHYYLAIAIITHRFGASIHQWSGSKLGYLIHHHFLHPTIIQVFQVAELANHNSNPRRRTDASPPIVHFAKVV